MKLKITLRGPEKVLNQIKRLGVNLKDFSSELKDVGEYLVDFYGGPVFDTEGQIIGERWAPLKPKYEFWKRVKYPGRGILEMTGTLRRSFGYEVERIRMKFYNPIIYARTHQFGDTRRSIPQRVFFKIDDERRKKIVEIIHQGLQRRLNIAYG